MSKFTPDTRHAYKERYDIYIDQIKALAARKKRLDARYLDHIQGTDRHRLTKEAIQLGNVNNGPVMTKEQAESETAVLSHVYATPLSVFQTINHQFTPIHDDHVFNYNNPHRLTPYQLLSWTSKEINDYADRFYNRGETVKTTTRLGGTKNANNVTIKPGETFPEAYITLRSNLNAAEIKSGMVRMEHITPQPTPPQKSTISLTAADTLSWKRIIPPAGAQNVFLYVGPTYGRLALYPSTIAAWMNINHPPTNLSNGVIGIVRVRSSGRDAVGIGNGTDYRHFSFYTTMIVQVRDRRWVA